MYSIRSQYPHAAEVEIKGWHAARETALLALEQWRTQIQRSVDPDATSALADLAPMIRLLGAPAADLITLHAIERRWRDDPAWMDLRHDAPEIFGPLQSAWQALVNKLRGD